MTELEFRGKSLDKGWVYGYAVHTRDTSFICYSDETDDDLFLSPQNIFIPVTPESISQFIVRKDKEGNKIYVGDILYDDEVFKAHFLVVYDEESCQFIGLKIGDRDKNILEFPQLSECGKVVGNATDNPELLSWSKTRRNME